jgi:hypothetical protein
MSIFRQAVNIPTAASSVTSIAGYPNGAAAGQLTLNGSLVGITGQVSFINMGYASGLSFISGDDISNVTFTIVGTYNGLIIQEILAGPTGGNVGYTDHLFHTIVSISIDQSINTTLDIGSNYNIAVVLPDGNSKAGFTHPNYTYSVLLNSIAATGNWVAGTAIIYGVSNNAPLSLEVTNLTYANRPSNYFSLPVEGEALVGFSKDELNNGILVQTTYPYAAVIVYLANGVNTTPVYIEISQS